jgi:hypothetical protein
MRWKKGMLAVLLAATPLTAQAQEAPQQDLPRDVADSVIAFFNDPSTIRFLGRAQVPPGSSIQGNVAVLGGPLHVAGEIMGDVVVVNGSLNLVEGGRITGDVRVVGGSVTGPPEAVLGLLTTFRQPLDYRRQGDRIAYDDRPWSKWAERRRTAAAYLSLRSEGNYNRVEGLPVWFGPVFRTRVQNYFRAEALAIWRSESGISLSPDELGYFIRAEQHFGQGGNFALGGTAYSQVQQIEGGGLLDIEASLATFLLHQDFRDYYQREGFSAFLRYVDEDAGVRLGAEYRDEDHAFADVNSPWTIRQNDGPWRPQPLVGEGRLRSISGELVLDARNDRRDPSDGWYLQAQATMGVGGSLTIPTYHDADPGPDAGVWPPREVGTDFSVGSVDLRRYARLGPGADLRLRGVLAGSLDGDPVPPQYQRALGGEGSLPGFRLMTLDCGARSKTYSVIRQIDGVDTSIPVFAGYGCDRVAMFQAEYRGSFFFNVDLSPDDEWADDRRWYPALDFNPGWSVFFDAGRGWTLSDEGTPGYLGPTSNTLMDVGVGFFLGNVGIYWAWPLNGDDRNVNFFLRLAHRF